jgi:quercetin dioxygenase-like cupin family protein
MTDSREGFVIAPEGELEQTGNWSLVRRSLDCRSFGINLVEIPPGESIPEHDESGRDQEEVFFVVAGSPTLVIDGEDYPVSAGTFARLDPHHRRTVRNGSDEAARVLIVSAPRTSGYEPMEWA